MENLRQFQITIIIQIISFSVEEMTDPMNQFEFTLYILNQYYVLLTRGIDGIRLGFWDGNDSFRKYMEDTLDIGA